MADYISMFNPLPVEYGRENLERAANRYDYWLTNMLETKDAYSQIPTGAEEIPIKNQLLGNFMDQNEEIVKTKYQGDWGAAAKELAARTTQLKSNEFWQYAPILQQRREEERRLKTQFGPNALPFKSLSGKQFFDQTGKFIGKPEDMDYEIEERLNDVPVMESMWNQIPEIRNYVEDQEIRNAAGQVIGYKTGISEGISKDMIKNYLGEAFSRYQDTANYSQRKREYMELNGITSDEADAKIKSDLLSTGMERVGMSSTWRYHNLPSRATASGSGSGGIYIMPEAPSSPVATKSVPEFRREKNSIERQLSRLASNDPQVPVLKERLEQLNANLNTFMSEDVTREIYTKNTNTIISEFSSELKKEGITNQEITDALISGNVPESWKQITSVNRLGASPMGSRGVSSLYNAVKYGQNISKKAINKIRPDIASGTKLLIASGAEGDEKIDTRINNYNQLITQVFRENMPELYTLDKRSIWDVIKKEKDYKDEVSIKNSTLTASPTFKNGKLVQSLVLKDKNGNILGHEDVYSPNNQREQIRELELLGLEMSQSPNLETKQNGILIATTSKYMPKVQSLDIHNNVMGEVFPKTDKSPEVYYEIPTEEDLNQIEQRYGVQINKKNLGLDNPLYFFYTLDEKKNKDYISSQGVPLVAEDEISFAQQIGAIDNWLNKE